ncbi:MAG: hypothetical protein ACREPL_15060 [Rhodanobacteraceae bacterium]
MIAALKRDGDALAADYALAADRAEDPAHGIHPYLGFERAP